MQFVMEKRQKMKEQQTKKAETLARIQNVVLVLHEAAIRQLNNKQL